MRTISLTGNKLEELHLELPGCIVNVMVGLHNREGQKVTRISISADGERYAGDEEWWAVIGKDRKPTTGIGVRIIQGTKRAIRKVLRAECV